MQSLVATEIGEVVLAHAEGYHDRIDALELDLNPVVQDALAVYLALSFTADQEPVADIYDIDPERLARAARAYESTRLGQ